MKTDDKGWEKVADTERYHLARVVKSIVREPHMLDLADVDDEIKAGRTGVMIEMENDRRMKQYLMTVDKMVDHIQLLLAQAERRGMDMVLKAAEEHMVGMRGDETENMRRHPEVYDEALSDLIARFNGPQGKEN